MARLYGVEHAGLLILCDSLVQVLNKLLNNAIECRHERERQEAHPSRLRLAALAQDITQETRGRGIGRQLILGIYEAARAADTERV